MNEPDDALASARRQAELEIAKDRPAKATRALTYVLEELVPIPGTTQRTHLLGNIGASEVTFSPDELRDLNTALAAITIHGERLPAAVLAFSGVEAPMPR